MSEIIGKQIQVGVGTEESRGTPSTVAEKWMPKVVANVIERAEKTIDESSQGNVEDTIGARVTKKWYEGDLEMNVQADAIGYFLYNLYGADTASVVAGSVYQHIFKMAQNIIHPSLNLFMHDGSISKEVLSNGMVSTLEIQANVDEYVKAIINFVAKTGAANTDTPSYDTEYDFIGKDITVKVAATEGGLAGATETVIKSVNITFDTGLIRDHVIGEYNPDDIYNAKLSIEGEMVLNYIDDTFKDLFTGDSYQYIEITIQDTSTDLGGGNNPSLTLLLNRASVIDWTRDGAQDELVTQTVRFKGLYNTSDSQQSELTLQNLTAEYDTGIS